MASTDAIPVPRKNQAYRFTFAIRKPSDQTLITTWAGQDSEVSLDGAAFSDCANEATEIGTSGVGYIDLTASEMNADTVALKITVTNTGAVPLVFTFLPESAGDYRVADTQKVDVETIKTQAVTAAAGITFGVYVGGTGAAALASTALSTATWTGTLATNLGTTNTTVATNLDATVSSRGTSTLTQTQVTGGAYALNSSSFGFNAALDFTTTQKAATLARVTLVDTTTTNTDMRGTNNAALAATALSTAVWTSPPTGFLAATFPATIASTTNITAATGIDVTKVDGSGLGTHTAGMFPADVRDFGGLGATIAVDSETNYPAVATLHVHADAISADAVSAAAVTKIQNGLATASELLLVKDRTSYCLTVLVGACADAGTAAETYVHAIGGETFTVDFTGLDDTGTRTTTTLSKV